MLYIQVIPCQLSCQDIVHFLRHARCIYLDDDAVHAQVTDAVVQTLQKSWVHLGSLSLSNCYLLTDSSLCIFESLPCLYNLFLSGNGLFTARGMSSVKQRIKLTTLRQCGINWAAV